MATTTDALPLRARKRARRKLGLLDETLRRLEKEPFEQIRIKDLCAAVEISEATFFNYFPQKSDILVYFIELWSLEMAWHASRFPAGRGGLAAIEEVFTLTARRFVESPSVMGEIIAFQARMRVAPRLDGVDPAERRLRFPSLEGIEDVGARQLRDVILPLVEQAVAAGELPARVDREQALTGIGAIFFGVPLVRRMGDGRSVEPAYRNQLRILWEGLRASRGGRRP